MDFRGEETAVLVYLVMCDVGDVGEATRRLMGIDEMGTRRGLREPMRFANRSSLASMLGL